jgi:hypothetical protein
MKRLVGIVILLMAIIVVVNVPMRTFFNDKEEALKNICYAQIIKFTWSDLSEEEKDRQARNIISYAVFAYEMGSSIWDVLVISQKEIEDVGTIIRLLETPSEYT